MSSSLTNVKPVALTRSVAPVFTGPVLARRHGRAAGRRHHRRHRRRHHKRIGYARRTNTEIIQNIGGLPDRQFVKLKYATTSAFTTTGGVASFLQLKLNSVYRPYAGNTDSDGGQAQMFSRYVNCLVRGSKVTIRLWSSATGAVPEPFRIVLIPVTPANYTTLSGLSNIVTICDMPHAIHRLVSPGAEMPYVQSYCSVNTLAFGDYKQNDEILRSSFTQTSGTDPSTILYWLVGYQNMAGTTNLDLQAEVTIEHYCEFYSQVLSTLPQMTWNGLNDQTPDKPEEKKEEKKDDMKKVEEPEEFDIIRVPKKKI